MEDFEDSTREMLEAVRAEQRKLRQRLAKLEEREKIILAWIAEEQPSHGQQELPINIGRPRVALNPKARLSSFLRDLITDGKPRTNAELADVAKARGIAAEDIDLRSIHFVMVSLKNAGKVNRQDGKWIARKTS